MLVKYATMWSILLLFFPALYWRSTSTQEAIMLLHMLLFGVFASNHAPFFGAKNASKRHYAL